MTPVMAADMTCPRVETRSGGLALSRIVAGMWRMAAALCAGRRSGSYRGLDLTAEVVADEHHGSAVLFGRALKAFYPPYPPPTPRQDVCTGR